MEAITVKQLQALADNLGVAKFLASLTGNTVDDWIVEMLVKVSGDEEMLQRIVDFLNWTPLFGDTEQGSDNSEPTLPDCCKEYDGNLRVMRDRIHA